MDEDAVGGGSCAKPEEIKEEVDRLQKETDQLRTNAKEDPNSNVWAEYLATHEALLATKKQEYLDARDPDDQRLSLDRAIQKLNRQVQKAEDELREAAAEEDAAANRRIEAQADLARKKHKLAECRDRLERIPKKGNHPLGTQPGLVGAHSALVDMLALLQSKLA